MSTLSCILLFLVILIYKNIIILWAISPYSYIFRNYAVELRNQYHEALNSLKNETIETLIVFDFVLQVRNISILDRSEDKQIGG